MSCESWENCVNSGSDFCYDENYQRVHGLGNEIWQVEEGTLSHLHNDIRISDIQKRNEEIFYKIKHFYFSKNGIILVGISIMLCLLTSTFSLEGLFFWNILFAFIVVGFCEIAVRTKVRADWREIWKEIENF
jgi:hypothetical protein